MCQWGTHRIIHVIRRNHPGMVDGWHAVAVDACIANYVQIMNLRGIITLGCCCGHGRGLGLVLVDAGSTALMEQYGYNYQVIEDQFLDESQVSFAETRLYHYLPQGGNMGETIQVEGIEYTLDGARFCQLIEFPELGCTGMVVGHHEKTNIWLVRLFLGHYLTLSEEWFVKREKSDSVK